MSGNSSKRITYQKIAQRTKEEDIVAKKVSVKGGFTSTYDRALLPLIVAIVAIMLLVGCIQPAPPATTIPPPTAPPAKDIQALMDVHQEKAGLGCKDCHPTLDASQYMQTENGKFKAVEPVSSPIVVNKDICLNCHKAGEQAWYGDKVFAAGEAY